MKPHTFRSVTLSTASSFSQSQPQALLHRSFSQLRGLSIAGGSPKKRKSVDVGGRPSKRSRSNSQRSDKAKQEREVTNSVEDTQTTSLYVPNESSFDNRVFRCLVISPAGRGIRDFQSIKELLKALRDAIKAHRSLYLMGNILHRDISENNIIITDPKKANGFTGMLIDLDLAKEIGSGRSGARHQTGTMEFMAIQVLRNVSHTYRHDLESFFYVLLWICGRRVWDRGFRCRSNDRPTESILTKWYSGSFKEIARSKQGDMHIDGFEDILEEFPPVFDSVKPLCRKIRGILFSLLKNGGLYIGTPPNSETLYDPIIKAFDDAIAGIAITEGRPG
jgi:5-carboxymethyl-2-hydroxymuconate isomerase